MASVSNDKAVNDQESNTEKTFMPGVLTPGELIVKYKEEHKLSLTKLSYELEATPAVIQKWIQLNNLPTKYSTIKRLMNLCKLTPEQMALSYFKAICLRGMDMEHAE